MNYSDLRYRLGILLVVVAILATLGISSPRPAELNASIPRLGDLAPPPPPPVASSPSVPAVSESKAQFPTSLDGDATWYGKVLHGHRTASGERFDMYRFTAAHRELPFGTLLRVTNRKNGKWVVVRITDRGTLAPGRVIDLSLAAARQLGMVRPGVVAVHIEKVGFKAPKIPVQPQPIREAKLRPPQK